MLDDWLPYHPNSRVALTCVRLGGHDYEGDAYLHTVDMAGTARPDERRAFAKGEGIWWIRGHHTEDSPEGVALLAAFALDRCSA